NNPLCSIHSIIAPSTLRQQPVNWWQQHACSGIFSGIRYHYVLEQLDSRECCTLWKNDKNQTVTMIFYRLTLFFPALTPIFLQSTLAVPMETASGFSPCPSDLCKVTPGRQRLVELIM
ncbi:MAG TPA: hypothetical protein VHZ76_09400, partial [Gammaproteobacteria bacterium]|nr:hypothetical protein [Gammaproteobacteria bacterium]